MGFWASFAQPARKLALFTLVFSTMMKVSPGMAQRTDHFTVSLFCGLLSWMAMQKNIIRDLAPRSIVEALSNGAIARPRPIALDLEPVRGGRNRRNVASELVGY